MPFKCDLCNLELSNDAQFKQHLEGRKHKKLESVRDEREKSALRSIFVTGLKKDFFIKHIEEHFEKFGKILKIVIDKERNSYAIVEYENEKCVEAALNTVEHVLNGKTVKVKRRVNKEFVSKVANHSEKKKEILEQHKKELLAINKFLAQCTDFDEQTIKFIDYMKLPQTNLNERNEITNELNSLFKRFLPTSTVSIFGSTANGLGCIGSDMDVTILFEDYLNNKDHNKKLEQKIDDKITKQNSSDSSLSNNSSTNNQQMDEDDSDEELDTAKEQNNNIYYYSEEVFAEKTKNFLNLDIDEQVNILVKILQRYSSEIQDVRKITNTRCPIIRFYHEKTKVYCDLTINNYLVIENTNLIRLFLSLNENLEKLIFIIRYWFKQKSLHGSLKFNSYTIIWLLIFYLQQIKQLPTVEFLMKLNNQEKKMLFGWNCAYETNVEYIKSQFKINTDVKFTDLLKGFFEFYSAFNFAPKILMSVRSGSFEELNSNSDISKANCINLQDPFDLAHNLSANISERSLERFKSEANQSNILLKHCTQHRATKCWGLSMLFTKKTPELVANKSLENNSVHIIEININNECAQNEIDFVLNLMKDCLMFNILNENKKQPKRKAPITQICNQVDSLGLNASPKRIRVSDNPEKFAYALMTNEDCLSNKENEDDVKDAYFKDCYIVHVNKNTWQGRRNVRRDLIKSNIEENLVLEKLISEKLIENENKSANFDLNFQLSFFTSPYVNNDQDDMKDKFKLKIQFDLINDDNKNPEFLMYFDTLVHFLDIYLNSSFQKYFKA